MAAFPGFSRANESTTRATLTLAVPSPSVWLLHSARITPRLLVRVTVQG